MSENVFTSIRFWMNRLVELYKESEGLEEFSKDISVSRPFDQYGIQVNRGIEKMAKNVACTIRVEQSECGIYIEKSFVYKGVRFYQLDVAKGDGDYEVH